MALIKQCTVCSQKGMFLKLINGICQSCTEDIHELESKYTKILQKLATSPNNKESLVADLTLLIFNFKKYDGISKNLSLKDLENLLQSISINIQTAPHKNVEEIKYPPVIEIEPSSEIIKKPISPPNVDTSLNNFNDTSTITLNLNSKLPPSNNSHYKLDVPSDFDMKIRNLIEPLDILENSSIEETKPNIPISIKTNLNLSLNQKNNYKPISNKNFASITNDKISEFTNSNKQEPTIKMHSIKDSLMISNIKSRCSILIKKIENSNETLESIAENYFIIKNDMLPTLEKYDITEVDGTNILNFLESIKNKLCLRSKKKEHELFDFFNYIAIFIQTTGISPVKCDIMEISALKISYGNIVDEYYSLVNPIKSIKLAITNATGISNEDVANSPTIDLILPDLLKFISDFQLVAFNHRPVDIFLNSLLINLGFPKLSKSVTSTVNLYRIRFKNFHGSAANLFDITTCCKDLLAPEDLNYINSFDNISSSYSHATYKLYEILKYKYK